jgi:hypothetical protein
MWYKHGKNGQRLCNIWYSMIARCEHKNNRGYEGYGGRGIKVCDEWHDVNVFYKWALSNGYADNLTIDRINNDGNYEPSNCRWVTRKEQANNRRTNVYVEYRGKKYTVDELAETHGINSDVLRARIFNHGWTLERALSMKERPMDVIIEYNGERKNMSQWSKETGIHFTTIKRRYRNGLSAEKIFEKKQPKYGHFGIGFNKASNKYTAHIKINGKNKHLGYFETAEEAYEAYCIAERQEPEKAVV